MTENSGVKVADNAEASSVNFVNNSSSGQNSLQVPNKGRAYLRDRRRNAVHEGGGGGFVPYCIRSLLKRGGFPIVTCSVDDEMSIIIKNKHRNRLDDTADMRLALSSTEPRIQKLVKSMQSKKSH
ncbi:hypothetical protein ACJJTC_002960 [Scirpophaga incertulas]